MKTQRLLQIFLVGIVLVLLNACATYPRTGSGALVGTWTNSLGTVWTINADNTFHVVAAKRHIWGNLTVAGDTVTIQEAGGRPRKAAKARAFIISAAAPKTLWRLRWSGMAARSEAKT